MITKIPFWHHYSYPWHSICLIWGCVSHSQSSISNVSFGTPFIISQSQDTISTSRFKSPPSARSDYCNISITQNSMNTPYSTELLPPHVINNGHNYFLQDSTETPCSTNSQSKSVSVYDNNSIIHDYRNSLHHQFIASIR